MMMSEELMMMGGFEDGPDPIGILILCSFFRDDMPWLYEVGLETYKAIQTGDERATERALERFRRVAKMTTRGPWMEEMGVSGKEMDMFMMELPSMIEHMKERMMMTRTKPTNPKK